MRSCRWNRPHSDQRLAGILDSSSSPVEQKHGVRSSLRVKLNVLQLCCLLDILGNNPSDTVVAAVAATSAAYVVYAAYVEYAAHAAYAAYVVVAAGAGGDATAAAASAALAFGAAAVGVAADIVVVVVVAVAAAAASAAADAAGGRGGVATAIVFAFPQFFAVCYVFVTFMIKCCKTSLTSQNATIMAW